MRSKSAVFHNRRNISLFDIHVDHQHGTCNFEKYFPKTCNTDLSTFQPQIPELSKTVQSSSIHILVK